MNIPAPLEHKVFQSAIGTAVGYSLILGVMTILLFGVPYGIFYFLL